MTRLFARSDDVSRSAEPGDELPGVFPYTRGIQPTMYRGRLWTMRQYAGFGTAAASNARYRYLLGQGVSGLSVAFDLPTQMGYDSDHQMAAGEVGRVGVAIDSIEDMAQLFDGIPLDQVSTSMTINATAAILLAMYVVVGEEQGVDRTALRGTLPHAHRRRWPWKLLPSVPGPPGSRPNPFRPPHAAELGDQRRDQSSVSRLRAKCRNARAGNDHHLRGPMPRKNCAIVDMRFRGCQTRFLCV